MTVQVDIRMITLELPLAFTVTGAKPFTDGMEALPPFVSQKTSIAVWWVTSTRLEMDPSLRTGTKFVLATLVWNWEKVEVAGKTL